MPCEKKHERIKSILTMSTVKEVPPGWQEFTDKKSGRKYLYNPETKETKWGDELWKKPGWAKGEATLNKTENGEELKKDGNLAKPITKIRDFIGKK